MGVRFLFSRLGWVGLLVGGLLVLEENCGGWCNMMAPSGGSGATWKEDTGEINILLESSWETEDTGSSVNQPVAPPVPPANPVASRGEEAGPSNQPLPVEAYPYTDTEVIGGDSVSAIQLRLLEKYPSPSAAIIGGARLEAQDLFEVKVEILKLMAGLDPQGDWMGRGALALDNPHTATGEESLGKLYSLLGDLQRDGVQSATYSQLKGKVFLRMDPDEHSSA